MTLIKDKKIIEKELQEGVIRLIELLNSIIAKCSAAELCYFIASLNFMYIDEVKNKLDQNQSILRQNLSDIYKYLISLLASVQNLPTEFEKVSEKRLIENLVDCVRGINDKYQAINGINFYGNASLDTITNQVTIKIDKLSSDPFVKSLNSYGIRVQRNLNKDLELKSIETGIDEVLDGFAIFNDLINVAIGISTIEIKEIVLRLKNEIDLRYTDAYDKFNFKEKDVINSEDYNNHILFTSLLMFSKEHLLEIHPKINEFIEVFTFNPQDFDPFELRYNYIDKKSIIKLGDFYIISFELLVNSLHAGLHYSLLESDATKENYKRRESSLFEEKISGIALKYGFKTTERNVDLYEGKRNLGDIDLILGNADGRTIYVEAKSYSLHSNIQAHDPIEMQRQLSIQREKWESKVQQRIEYLKKHKGNSTVEYIIVTKKPEILSHFSDILVLNIREFEYWLENGGNIDFETLYTDLYDSDDYISDETLKECSPNWDSK
jgi:flagellin-specific chaperone FliS